MSKTAIEWAEEVWNPTTGCTRVSEGCRNCYAFSIHDMRHEAYQNGKKVPEQYAKPFTELQLFQDRLSIPLKRKKPTMWFVNSMSDLFHKDIPDEFIDQVFAVMALADWHTFQVLTKRPERAAEYINGRAYGRWCEIARETECDRSRRDNGYPLENIWIGTSVENQKAADERIPHLLEIPAAVRFLSVEPLLGPVDLRTVGGIETNGGRFGWNVLHQETNSVDWVIVGGESGHDARPCNVQWIRDIRDQCRAAGVPCFIKQLGAVPFVEGGRAANPDRIPMASYRRASVSGHDTDTPRVTYTLHDSKGGDWEEWPEDLKVREFPQPQTITGG